MNKFGLYLIMFVCLSQPVSLLAHQKVVVIPLGSPDISEVSYEIVDQDYSYTLCGGQTCGILREVTCPSGKRVVGGGVDNPHFGTVVVESHPEGTTGWQAWVMNITASSIAGTMTVQAICADVAVSADIAVSADNADSNALRPAPSDSATASRNTNSSTAVFLANAYDPSSDIRLQAIDGLWNIIRKTSKIDEATLLVLENALSDSDQGVAELARQAVDFIESLELAGPLQK